MGGQVNNKTKSSRWAEFIITENKAYFRDKRYKLVCQNSIHMEKSIYRGYRYEYDYKLNLEWFRRYILLLIVNNKKVRFIGVSKDDFIGNINETSVDEIDIGI